MTDICEFIAARLDEDEAAAQAAWSDRRAWSYDRDHFEVRTAGGEPVASTARYTTGGDWTHTTILEAEGDHIARHDPARVLREVEAKRAILTGHAPQITVQSVLGEPETLSCGACGNWDEYPVAYPCPTLRHLAAVYRDHEDYRPEWAPYEEQP